MSDGSDGRGSIWEDGLGRRDLDARVLWEGEQALTADPQSVRYGDGRARVVAQAVIGGPVFRNRPAVDVLVSEGLRPLFVRLSAEQARGVAGLLVQAADRAEEGSS